MTSVSFILLSNTKSRNCRYNIEHIVEVEAFELNTEIVTNKKQHAATVGNLRVSHVKIEAQGLQNWENSRMKWRQLRHDKALKEFEQHIGSPEFVDPAARQEFMRQTRNSQAYRRQLLLSQFAQLGQLTADNISVERVRRVQTEVHSLHEREESAIQACHNGLEELGTVHAQATADRVEALRKELHQYGALHREPDLAHVATLLTAALTDPDLTELFRIGGGLKVDLSPPIPSLPFPS